MARTLADLRAEVLGNDFDTTTYSTRAVVYINEALGRVARRVKLPPLEATQAYTTVAGTATLTLPTDDVRVLSLFDATDHQPLENVDIGDIDSTASSSGKPYAYALYGGGVTLYPTPDRAYSLTLRYRKVGLEFTNDADTTTSLSFPDDYSDVLVSYARWKLYRAEDDGPGAQFWQAQYEGQLAEMRADVQLPSEDQPRQVPSMWEDESPAPTFTWGG